MKVGIIGAGMIGGTLARRLVALGHEVAVANSRGPQTLTELAEETGARAVSVADAVRDAELVVITIPERAVEALPRDLFDGVPESLVVVDTGNYYPRERDGRIEGIEGGLTESRWVASQLGRPVIKAFNTINYRSLLDRGQPAGAADRIVIPIAGDDAAGKATVMELVEELGFDAIDAGSLDESWRQQPGTPVYAADMAMAEAKAALEQARPERQPAFSGTDQSPGDFRNPR